LGAAGLQLIRPGMINSNTGCCPLLSKVASPDDGQASAARPTVHQVAGHNQAGVIAAKSAIGKNM